MKKQYDIACSVIIPDEILIEVLQRMPVESMQTLRLVCKLWNSTICSPSFITAYNQRRRNHTTGTPAIALLCDRDLYICQLKQYPHDDIHNNEYSTITCMELSLPANINASCLAYSEGLFCFLPRYAQHLRDEEAILWNPILKQRYGLPRIRYPCDYLERAGIQSKLILGFGYDITSCDYKVVRGTLYLDKINMTTPLRLRANVFSLKAQAWTRIDVQLPYPVVTVHGVGLHVHVVHVHGMHVHGVHVDGVLYWTFGQCILAFNLANNAFYNNSVPLPREVSNFDDIQIMAVKVLTHQDQDEKEVAITLGVVVTQSVVNVNYVRQQERALWVITDSQSVGGTMSWIKVLAVVSGSRLANYLDVKVVDRQVNLAKSKEGKWIVCHLKGETEIHTSIKVKNITEICGSIQSQNTIAKTLHLVTSFQESLALVGVGVEFKLHHDSNYQKWSKVYWGSEHRTRKARKMTWKIESDGAQQIRME